MQPSTIRVATRYLDRQAAAPENKWTAAWQRLSSGAPHLSILLATLRAGQLMHWTAHWTAQGPNSYSDHLLFERLYSSLTQEIDGLAEKLIATAGPMPVDPRLQVSTMHSLIQSWMEMDILDPAALALQVEEDILSAITRCLEGSGADFPVGTRNFLEDLADSHETNIYLLKQRVTPARTAALRVAQRHHESTP